MLELHSYVLRQFKSKYLSLLSHKSPKQFLFRLKSDLQRSSIFALSSGYGKCGVAVIRVSGPQSSQVVTEVGNLKHLPEPRKVFLRRLRDPTTNSVLDRGLLIWFPGPNSFTGEDCCELQVHGGTAVVAAVLKALGKIPGLRPAEPGEFSKRAFYNGKMDLTEAEGLADLIHAETEVQRQQAFNQMEGSLHDLYSSWRQVLKQSVAHIEAYIDFSEDQNIEDNILGDTNQNLHKLRSSIQRHLNDSRQGERTRDGVRTAIVGAPNVGKSSLLNALCRQPAAIVSSIPGTTRDVIKTTLDIGGYPVVLFDTAGLRTDTNDVVEIEGISRAHDAANNSDLILLVIDASNYIKWSFKFGDGITSPFLMFLKDYINILDLNDVVDACRNLKSVLNHDSSGQNEQFGDKMCLVVFNKLDLVEDQSLIEDICRSYKDVVLPISCSKETNFERLLDSMKTCLGTLCGNPSRENPTFSQARHRHHIESCLASLNRYLSMPEREIDLAAQQLQKSLNSLGKITGHVSTEEILDVIFKDFCIGK